MVYINSRGEIVDSKSTYNKIAAFFFGIYAAIILFFKTLLEPFISQDQGSRLGGNRDSGLNRGSNTRRRIGGFSSMGDSPSAPPCVGSS
ncbi:seleno K [Brachionus plicatilis]|uniref:Seleno K n=1 Tax=Brachionus plicatilis TaxID=10195 RepID=A0A3M7RHZ0_BRAPC|nr:seleno K [Brachionus plicatilis]